MPDARRIRVEVAYADPQWQIVRIVEIDAAATVDDAISTSRILDALPADFKPAALGIFGRRVAPGSPLRDGDRIELYRPLLIDPKEARRRRVKR